MAPSRQCNGTTGGKKNLTVSCGETKQRLPEEDHSPITSARSNDWAECRNKKVSAPSRRRDMSLDISFYRTSAGKDREGNIHVRPRSVEQYVTGAGGYFAQHGFFESPIVSRVQTFGNIAHILCSYESRNAPGEAPFARGINSFELAYDGKRWWIVSILWDEERPDNPIPKEFAARP